MDEAKKSVKFDRHADGVSGPRKVIEKMPPEGMATSQWLLASQTPSWPLRTIPAEHPGSPSAARRIEAADLFGFLTTEPNAEIAVPPAGDASYPHDA